MHNYLLTSIFSALLTLLSITTLMPYAWMLVTSFKDPMTIFVIPPRWIPEPFTLANYRTILQETTFFRSLLNTARIFLVVLPVGLFTTSLAAFSFAKLRFRGKGFAFLLLLSTMMIPFPAVMLPQYIFYSFAGLRDSYLPLILPGLFGNIGAMFFIVQYLKGFPDAMIDSAKIDGVGFFGIYRYIIVPNIRNALFTQGIFWFMGIWNDLLGPIIYLDSVEKYPVTAMLAALNTQRNTLSDTSVIMAGSMLASIPLILLYAIFQRRIVNSIVLTGIKG